MRHTLTLRLALTVAAAVVLASCGLRHGHATDTTAGRVAYMNSCASCHGTDLAGTPDGPAMLSDAWLDPSRPDAVYASVIDRRIGWDDTVDTDALIAYIRDRQSADR